jgi:sigma-E factor negative regulatory protein RseA
MERISAFMDGEASPAETHQAMLNLKQDGECEETWATFHLIGDVMRGDPLLQDGFMARFQATLESEPTQLAPRRLPMRKYANYALSAAASLSAVAVVGMLAFSDGMLAFSDNPLLPKTEVAQAPATSQPSSIEPRVRPAAAVNPGKVNEYLMAHQEYSPSTAFQGVAPYVRTVSETHAGDNR